MHYEHTEIGFNYRMSNLLAALGRAQLETLPMRVAARRRIRDRYRELLDGVPGVTFMPEAAYGTSNAWLTCIVLDPDAFGADRETVRLALEAEDIEARPLWKPMHLQPIFASHRTFGGEVGARLFERGLCLPSGSSLTDDDQDRVVATLLAARRRARPRRARAAYVGAATVSTTSSQWLHCSVRPLTTSRYVRWSSSVTSPTPSSTSSTARTGVTSAAVPVMKTSSAR